MYDFKEGQIFKNYVELCEFCGLDAKAGGNKRKKDQEKISRYAEFERQGHKWIVKKVYEQPIVQYQSRDGRFLKYIEPLLLDMLVDKDEMVITKPALFRALGIVERRYYSNDEETKLCEDRDVSSKWLEYFKVHTNTVLNKILMSALNSMVKRKILSFDENWMVTDIINGRAYVDGKLKAVEVFSGKCREATEEEKAYIQHISDVVAREMKGSKKTIYFSAKRNKELQDRIDKRIRKEKKISIERKIIIIVPCNIDQNYELSKEQIKSLKEKLKGEIVDKLKYYFDRDYNVVTQEKVENERKQALIGTVPEVFCKHYKEPEFLRDINECITYYFKNDQNIPIE